MDGYILTQTELKDIPDAKEKTWEVLEQGYRILRQEGEYFTKILKRG